MSHSDEKNTLLLDESLTTDDRGRKIFFSYQVLKENDDVDVLQKQPENNDDDDDINGTQQQQQHHHSHDDLNVSNHLQVTSSSRSLAASSSIRQNNNSQTTHNTTLLSITHNQQTNVTLTFRSKKLDDIMKHMDGSTQDLVSGGRIIVTNKNTNTHDKKSDHTSNNTSEPTKKNLMFPSSYENNNNNGSNNNNDTNDDAENQARQRQHQQQQHHAENLLSRSEGTANIDNVSIFLQNVEVTDAARILTRCAQTAKKQDKNHDDLDTTTFQDSQSVSANSSPPHSHAPRAVTPNPSLAPAPSSSSHSSKKDALPPLPVVPRFIYDAIRNGGRLQNNNDDHSNTIMMNAGRCCRLAHQHHHHHNDNHRIASRVVRALRANIEKAGSFEAGSLNKDDDNRATLDIHHHQQHSDSKRQSNSPCSAQQQQQQQQHQRRIRSPQTSSSHSAPAKSRKSAFERFLVISGVSRTPAVPRNHQQALRTPSTGVASFFTPLTEADVTNNNSRTNQQTTTTNIIQHSQTKNSGDNNSVSFAKKSQLAGSFVQKMYPSAFTSAKSASVLATGTHDISSSEKFYGHHQSAASASGFENHPAEQLNVLKKLGEGTEGAAFLVTLKNRSTPTSDDDDKSTGSVLMTADSVRPKKSPVPSASAPTPNGCLYSAMACSEPDVCLTYRNLKTGVTTSRRVASREEVFVCKVEKNPSAFPLDNGDQSVTSTSLFKSCESTDRPNVSVIAEEHARRRAQRQHNEAHILSNIAHPNVIGFVDFQVDSKSGHQYLLLEYVDGGDLFKHLSDRRKANALLSEPTALDTSVQVLLAVEYLHRHNIIHRDIKSQNILVSKKNNFVKLTDFGTARQFDTDIEFDVDNAARGSPYYLSPEICSGRHYSEKTDMWSLGVLLYELLCTGQRFPFMEADLESLQHSICTKRMGAMNTGSMPNGQTPSDDAITLVANLLQKDPADRPTALEVFAKHKCVQAALSRYMSRFHRVLVEPILTSQSHPAEKLRSIDPFFYELLLSHVAIIRENLRSCPAAGDFSVEFPMFSMSKNPQHPRVEEVASGPRGAFSNSRGFQSNLLRALSFKNSSRKLPGLLAEDTSSPLTPTSSGGLFQLAVK